MNIPMGFTESVAAWYSLIATNLQSFDNGVRIFLQDLKENVIQDLRSAPVYHFNHDPANDPDRFLLHFSNLTTGTGNVPKSDDLLVYSYEGCIYVGQLSAANTTGTLVVCDMTGREIFTSRLDGSSLSKFRIDAAEGYYIARVITGNRTVNRKVFLD